MKISIEEFDINPLLCVSLPGYIWQCGLKYTVFILQIFQYNYLILLLENNMCGGISGVLGGIYVKSGENKNVL